MTTTDAGAPGDFGAGVEHHEAPPRDTGQLWQGIPQAPSPPEDVPDQDAWETITSPPNMTAAPATAPLGYPGRAEIHEDKEQIGAPLFVSVVHPLEVLERPAEHVTSFTTQADATTRRLVPVNRHRTVLVVAPAVGIRVGGSEVTPLYGFPVSAGASLTLSTSDELYFVATGAAGEVDVLQLWTDE